MYSMQRFMLLIFIAIMGMGIITGFFYYQTEDTATITVIGKERVVDSMGETVTSKYLVFTESETFQNTDDFLYFKFNSSDIQGQLRKGNTYTVTVVGWRIPFMSAYRNIISIEQ